MQLLVLLIAMTAVLIAPARAAEPPYNAFHPDQTWLDNNGVHINAHGGGVLFQDGIYYWFGEHKTSGRRGNSAQVGVHAYTSIDLYNWKDEGIALTVSDDPDSEITRGCVIERPKVIYNPRTRKFVMWFHLELRWQGYRAARTGVAVSEQPTGPYEYLRSLRPNAGHWPMNMSEEQRGSTLTGDDPKAVRSGSFLRRDLEGGQMARDMTLFIDDDGKAYHIFASEENYTLHIAELTEDYLDFTGKYIRVLPGGHNEAPAICKWENKYWMITSGCTGWSPNAARSAVADSIWGPWKSLGNPCEGVNPHTGLGPEKTFGAQSTFLLPVQNQPGRFIAMFDVWEPRNPIDGRYIWLPVEFTNGRINVTFQPWWQMPTTPPAPQ